MPFVRLLLPLVLGILSAVFIKVDLGLFVLFLILGFVGMLALINIKDFRIAFRVQFFQAPLIFLMIWGLGGVLTLNSISKDEANHFSSIEQVTWMKGRLTENLTEKPRSMRSVIRIEAVRAKGRWKTAEGGLLVYLEKDSLAKGLERGDVVLFENKSKEVEAPANPGEFNYKRFLSFRDIYHQQYLAAGSWSLIEKEADLLTYAERARTTMIDRLEAAGLGKDEMAIASALLLGKKDQLSSELMHAYAGAGAMHVLAVSGLHVGILYLILAFLLQPLEKLRHGLIYKTIVILVLLWGFGFITGLSPSVVRAATMFTAVAMAKMLKRTSNIYNTIAASAFVLLVFNPFYIMEVGFQLSYLAVLGIIFLQPRLKSLLYFPNKPLRWAWEISCVSLAAQIATFPLGLLYFHQFPTYFLFSNLIVIPAATLILCVGFVFFLTCWIPLVGEWVGFLLKWVIYGLNQAVHFVQELPSALMQGIDISISETWLIYLVIILLSVALIFRKKKALIASLATVFLVLGLQLWDKIDFQRHDFLTVYDVDRSAVVNLLSDDVNIVFTDSLMATDANKQQFHLRNNWNKHAAPEPEFHTSLRSDFKQILPGLFEFKGKTFALVDSWEDIPKLKEPVEVDYLIISYFRGVKMEAIERAYQADQIIIDSTVREKKATSLMATLDGEQKVHAVVLDGYFEERLR